MQKKPAFVLIAVLLTMIIPTSCSQAAEIYLDNSITMPYCLNQSNSVYILNSDIVTDGTALLVGASNITIDLNGHTIIFGNLDMSGVPNYDFEEGGGEIPDSWDLSLAPSAKRVATSDMPLVGNWLLKFDHPNTTEEVISGWTYLPKANRTYMAAAIVKSCWGCMHRLRVEYQNGSMIGEASSDNVERAPMLSVKFKPGQDGNYRLRIIFENPAGRESWIDYADIRPAYDAGIMMRNYFDSVRSPDIVGISCPGYRTNVTIRNGRIVEGQARGMVYRAISKESIGLLEISNLYIEVSGIDSSNFFAESSSNNIIHDSTIVSRVPYLVNRMDLSNFPVLIGSDSRFYNNVIDGGQGGVSTSGYSNVNIYGNTIRINSSSSNHYSVTTYGSSNITVRNNRFESYAGPGVMFSSLTTNSSIMDNYFNISAQPCDAEYYTSLTSPAVRVTDYLYGTTYGNRVVNNTIVSTISTFPQYPLCHPTVIGLRMDASGEFNEFSNNYVSLKTTDTGAYAHGIKEGSTSHDIVKNNYIESNNLNIWMATDYSQTANAIFISNTFAKGVDPVNYHTFRIGYCCRINATNYTFIDSRFSGGASMDDILWGTGSDGGIYSYHVNWYLNATVTDGLSGVAGALVSVADKNGEAVFTGSTDSSGRISNIVLEQFYRYGTYVPYTSNYAIYTPHIITASFAGQSATATINMTSSMSITLQLGNAPHIQLTKTVDKAVAIAGDNLSYTISYQNAETVAANNAVISDSIPAGTAYVTGSATAGGIFDGNKITWNLGNLAVGAGGDVQFKVRVD